MKQLNSLLAPALAIVLLLVVPAAVLGQSVDPASPRTPWGDPDLQGIWTSSTYTPLQRPGNLADRALFTEEELADLNEILTAGGVDPLPARDVIASDDTAERLERTRQPDDVHYDNAVWLTEEQPKRLSSRRTSLIVDPPNGRIPPLVSEAQERAMKRHEAYSLDSYENRPVGERCLVWWHEGPPMLPAAYNDILRIFQTQDYVVIFQEMNNNGPRIVPLDGRPHLPSTIRQWPGDSRGHWDGETLVVDTINFNAKNPFNGSGHGLHVVERFTRDAEKGIHYEFTVDDPTAWARSWSAEFPLMKREGPLFEYACHEGNYDIRHILEVARHLDKATATEDTE